jgi:hypothetical protein
MKIDMTEVHNQKAALSTSQTSLSNQIETAKSSFVNLLHSDSLKGDVKSAINAKITNHQVPLLTNFSNAMSVLSAQYDKTIEQFQTTVSETAADAIIDTDYLQGILDNFSSIETSIATVDGKTASIYNSISDIISLTNPDASTITTPLSEGKTILTDTKTNMESFNGWQRGDEFDKVLKLQTNDLENLNKFSSSDFDSKDAKAFYNDTDFLKEVNKITEDVNSSTPLGLLTKISKQIIKLDKWVKKGTEIVKLGITYVKEIKFINGRKIVLNKTMSKVQLAEQRTVNGKSKVYKHDLYRRSDRKAKVYKEGTRYQEKTGITDIRKSNIGKGVKLTGWKNALKDAGKSGFAAAKDSFKSDLNPLSDFKGFKEAGKWAKGGKVLGVVGSVLSVGMNIKETFFDDKTSTTGQKLRNFVVNQTVDMAAGAGAAYAGAAIGTMIGGPLGTVVGAGLGMAFSWAMNNKLSFLGNKSVTDVAKDGLNWATDAIGSGFNSVAGWFGR